MSSTPRKHAECDTQPLPRFIIRPPQDGAPPGPAPRTLEYVVGSGASEESDKGTQQG